MQRITRWLPVLAVAGALTACASGGGRSKAMPASGIDWDAVMQKMMAGGVVGVHHGHLAQFVGDWDAKVTMVMAPGAPPEAMQGSATFRMALDGHYLMQDFQGDFQGQPFTGLGIMGYDVNKGEYWDTWMDSMSTFMAPLARGQCANNGKSFTYEGDWDNPYVGVLQHGRQVIEWQDINHFTFKNFTSWNGQPEYNDMVIAYSRKQ